MTSTSICNATRWRRQAVNASSRTPQAERTGLTALLASLRQGDTIVIWRLDRLGRSLKDLIYLVERFEAAGVGLRSLQESVDTASIGGRLVFHLFGALAEFERNLIRAERLPLGSSRSAKSVNMLCHFRTIPWLVPTRSATCMTNNGSDRRRMTRRMRSGELIFALTNGVPRRRVNLVPQFAHLNRGKAPFEHSSKRVWCLPQFGQCGGRWLSLTRRSHLPLGSSSNSHARQAVTRFPMSVDRLPICSPASTHEIGCDSKDTNRSSFLRCFSPSGGRPCD